MIPFFKLPRVNIRKETAFINKKNRAWKKSLIVNGKPLTSSTESSNNFSKMDAGNLQDGLSNHLYFIIFVIFNS
jgi:hypothetical protein